MTEHAARDRLWAATLDAMIRDMGAAIRRARFSPNWPARAFTGPIAIASERRVAAAQGVWTYLQMTTVPARVAAAPAEDAPPPWGRWSDA